MIPISCPTKISIITRLRGINSINFKDKNNYIPPENYKYTMFTPNDSSPSDILYISELPLEPSKINEIKKINNKNYNLNCLNFDKVYPESFPLDSIYQQILKNPINDLFYKKNSCMLFFGPSMGGKSYLLRGSPFKNDNESGLLTRAINEIFQRLEYNNNICVKLSVYQIFLDKVYDLLSNEDNKEVNINTNYSEINNSYNINILGLTKKEIKNSNEYDLNLREGINNRRNLAHYFGINDIKQKSHFIISIFLENKVENNDDNEYIPFSQFDFVELVSSNFGLVNENEKENNINIDQNLFQNTNDVFNSIADNIICLSHNSFSNNDTLLTLALKNTMKPNSNIIFMNCVIPWESPLKNSYTSLKFTNMIFNQICKNESNSHILNNINNNNISTNLTYSLDYSDNNMNINNNIFNNINNSNNSGYEKMNEYLNSLTIDSIDYLFPEKDIPKRNDKKEIRNYKNEINEDNNIYTKYNKKTNNTKILKPNNQNNKSKLIKLIKYDNNTSNINKKNNINKRLSKNKRNNNNLKRNNKSFDNRAISPKENKLKKLNEALKELEAKSNELNQNSINPDYLYTFNNPNINNINLDTNINNKTINYEENNKIIPDKNNTLIQYEKIKEEYSDLKSNNIILKEDLNRLEHANKTLECALTEQRNRNIELLNQNEELSHRLLKLEELLDEANVRDEKYKINEINIEKLLNEKLFLNSKINEDEKNYNKMKEEKEKYEIEYKVLNAKYMELKNNYDLLHNDYCNIKINHDEQFNQIEYKIDNLLKEIEKLQNENNILRNENEKQRLDVNNIINQRDDYKEKYNEQKNKNDLLCVKINEIENEFNDMKKEKMNEEYYRLKCEENKKNKNENKLKIVNELQNRIQRYREQRLKSDLYD